MKIVDYVFTVALLVGLLGGNNLCASEFFYDDDEASYPKITSPTVPSDCTFPLELCKYTTYFNKASSFAQKSNKAAKEIPFPTTDGFNETWSVASCKLMVDLFFLYDELVQSHATGHDIVKQYATANILSDSPFIILFINKLAGQELITLIELVKLGNFIGIPTVIRHAIAECLCKQLAKPKNSAFFNDPEYHFGDFLKIYEHFFKGFSTPMPTLEKTLYKAIEALTEQENMDDFILDTNYHEYNSRGGGATYAISKNFIVTAQPNRILKNTRICCRPTHSSNSQTFYTKTLSFEPRKLTVNDEGMVLFLNLNPKNLILLDQKGDQIKIVTKDKQGKFFDQKHSITYSHHTRGSENAATVHVMFHKEEMTPTYALVYDKPYVETEILNVASKNNTVFLLATVTNSRQKKKNCLFCYTVPPVEQEPEDLIQLKPQIAKDVPFEHFFLLNPSGSLLVGVDKTNKNNQLLILDTTSLDCLKKLSLDKWIEVSNIAFLNDSILVYYGMTDELVHIFDVISDVELGVIKSTYFDNLKKPFFVTASKRNLVVNKDENTSILITMSPQPAQDLFATITSRALQYASNDQQSLAIDQTSWAYKTLLQNQQTGESPFTYHKQPFEEKLFSKDLRILFDIEDETARYDRANVLLKKGIEWGIFSPEKDSLKEALLDLAKRYVNKTATSTGELINLIIEEDLNKLNFVEVDKTTQQVNSWLNTELHTGFLKRVLQWELLTPYKVYQHIAVAQRLRTIAPCTGAQTLATAFLPQQTRTLFSEFEKKFGVQARFIDALYARSLRKLRWHDYIWIAGAIYNTYKTFNNYRSYYNLGCDLYHLGRALYFANPGVLSQNMTAPALPLPTNITQGLNTTMNFTPAPLTLNPVSLH